LTKWHGTLNTKQEQQTYINIFVICQKLLAYSILFCNPYFLKIMGIRYC
jgi:hypothetical protein